MKAAVDVASMNTQALDLYASSPDGFTLQFAGGTIWQRPQVPPPPPHRSRG